MSPFSVQKPATLAQASPRRITAAKMRAASLVPKIRLEADPEQQILREAEVPLEREAAPCSWAHEPATGSALFRAILCLGLAIFLQSEAASQRERSRYLVRSGLPWSKTNQSRS
jgi:hypothetical protein